MEDDILSISAADGLCLVGDPNQAFLDQRPESKQSNKGVLTASWIKNKRGFLNLDTHPIKETYRLGASMMKIIGNVLPIL